MLHSADTVVLKRPQLLMEEAGKLEGHNDHHGKDDHEQDHEAHGAAVSSAPHDVLEFLLSCSHAAVSHVHILI